MHILLIWNRLCSGLILPQGMCGALLLLKSIIMTHPRFNRVGWMKVHGYISAFFLPLALLFVVTGLLNFFDVHGEKNIVQYKVEIISGFPLERDAAEIFMTSYLLQEKLPPLPDGYSYKKDHHRWDGLKTSYSLMQKPRHTMIVQRDYGFWDQMMLIHKGKAGLLFKILGLLLGVSFLIVLISGVVIVLKTLNLKDVAFQLMGAGLGTLIMVYLIS